MLFLDYIHQHRSTLLNGDFIFTLICMHRSLDSHAFYTEIACEVGVEKAVILFNIIHWLNKNVLNEHSVHDGVSWTYNSSRAFGAQFPYITQRSISRYLAELEENGWLVSRSDLNHSKFDKTKWYSWGVKLDGYIVGKRLVNNIQPISQNDQSVSHSVQTIPDITTDITTHINDVESVNGNDNKKEDVQERHSSVKEAMKHITPSPTLMRAQLQGPTNINVDERPFGDVSVPDTETPAPMEPVLIALIAASREIGVEIRWHGIQDKLKEAVALWGIDVVEKEFRDYATFIATLQNKVVKWDSFRLNRLTKQPTLQQLSSIKAKKTGSYMNSGPEHVKAALPKFEMDAWYYFNELQAGKMQIDAETLATLNRKIQVYPDGSMKQAMIKFYNNHLTM